MINEKEYSIIESLQPDFTEYADNSQFYYWMDYACELDLIMIQNDLVEYLNKRMLQLSPTSAEHNACVDVASTLQETLPSYQGVFKYV